jgi:hypothetical protein
MKPVDTRKVRELLEQFGCTKKGTELAGDKQRSPGLLRKVQATFESEFGPKWLEKGVR